MEEEIPPEGGAKIMGTQRQEAVSMIFEIGNQHAIIVTQRKDLKLQLSMANEEVELAFSLGHENLC